MNLLEVLHEHVTNPDNRELTYSISFCSLVILPAFMSQKLDGPVAGESVFPDFFSLRPFWGFSGSLSWLIHISFGQMLSHLAAQTGSRWGLEAGKPWRTWNIWQGVQWDQKQQQQQQWNWIAWVLERHSPHDVFSHFLKFSGCPKKKYWIYCRTFRDVFFYVCSFSFWAMLEDNGMTLFRKLAEISWKCQVTFLLPKATGKVMHETRFPEIFPWWFGFGDFCQLFY